MILKIFILLCALNFILCDVTSTTTQRPSRPRFVSRFSRTTTKQPPTTTPPTTITTTTPPTTTTTLPTTTKKPVTTTETPTTTNKTKTEVIQLYKECGKKDKDIHPWLAILEHTDPTSRKQRKTLSKGVLIHPQYVLTTVSSLHNSFPFWVVSGVRFGDPIGIGSDYRSRYNVSNIVHADVDEVIIHSKKDIAVIRLTKPVNVTEFVKPVCLPPSDNYNYRELYLHRCKRKSKGFRNVQMTSVLPIAPQDCSMLFTRKNAVFSLDEFCAWDDHGDNCAGDIGGPLLALIGDTYHVVGLHSYAPTMGEDQDLTGLPNVYTRVGVHLNWINTVFNVTQNVEVQTN